MSTFSPWAIGTARGILEAVVLLALALVGEAIGALDVPANVVPYAPIILAVVRSLEGLADKRIDPTPKVGIIKGKS